MKGKEWYQAKDVADVYEDKRFSRGGRLIDSREREAVLSALNPIEGKQILEIAAGTGRFSVMLAEAGADVIGLDISAEMLNHGRAKVQARHPSGSVTFIRGDAARLPFPDNHFDAVFAMRFFHLIPTPHRFLAEMRRVTRGTIFFDTFNTPSARTVYNWLLPMGSRLYRRDEVTELLDDSELVQTDVDHDFLVPYGCYRILPSMIARPIRRADVMLGKTNLGSRCASVSYWAASCPD